jgi:hypothetical protein
MVWTLLAIVRRNLQLTVGSYYSYNRSIVLRALCTAKLQFYDMLLQILPLSMAMLRLGELGIKNIQLPHRDSKPRPSR